MAYNGWQATVQNASSGSAIPLAEITVREGGPSGDIATIYSDTTGTAKANPFFATVNGFAQFFAAPGTYYLVGALNGQTTDGWYVTITADMDGPIVLRGTWNASAGTFPGGGTAAVGDMWIVSVDGTVNAVSFSVGNRITALADNASTTTYAGNWFKESYSIDVVSVQGRTGAVVLVKADVGLGDVDNISAATYDTARRLSVPGRAPVVAGYHAPIFDTSGRMALGIDDDGDVNLGNIKVHVGTSDRSGRSFVWAVSDTDAAAALAVDTTGRVWIAETVVPQTAPRDGAEFGWSVSDTAGRVALGVRHDGTVEAGGLILNDYTTPVDWSADYETANVRRYRGFDVALRVDGRFAYDIRRNPGSTTAVIQSAMPMILAPLYGQSNAGSGGNEGDPLILDALFPTAVFSFPVAFRSYGNAAFDAGLLIGLKPLQQTVGLQNDMPGPLLAFGLEHGWREALGRASPGVISWTAWEGGVALSSFIRGTTNWDNLLAGITAAVPAAASYGRTVQCPAITFVQGESGPISGYQTALEALADDLCVEVQTVLSLAAAPKLLIAQINCQDAALVGESKSGVRLDQLAAAQAAGRVVMAGPMYHCPMVDIAHSTNEGRMVFGEMLAEAHRVLHQTGAWVPLWPTGAVLTGANIDITFAVPFGDLQFDDDWVADVVNKGFAYSDSTTSATIASVSITGANTVRVALSGVPSGTSKTISYAIWADSTSDGWAAGRGLLYSESTTASLYHRLGHAVPSYIRHYCVAFEIGDL